MDKFPLRIGIAFIFTTHPKIQRRRIERRPKNQVSELKKGRVIMKKVTKTVCSVALVAVMLTGGCLLQACSQQSAPADLPETESKVVSRVETSSVSEVSEVSELEEPALKGVNDLTGLPMDEAKENNRPLAVMINNIDIAQPLMGVSKSDVMYECLAEGGITRIMACFKDPEGITEIGSVRSARPYYIRIAQGMDAVYMHSGGSEEAYALLGSGVIDEFDLGTDMMWRDEWRRENLGYEHSVLTSGELLENGIADYGVRRSYEGSSPETQVFSKTDSQVLAGEKADYLCASFSSYKDTTFTYDAAGQTYLVGQFGEAQMDGTYSVQVTRQNVLALYIPTYSPDGGLLQQMDLVGSGDGYYMSQGKIIPVVWHKDSYDTPFYYTTETGEALIMIPGNVYVCCVPLSGSVTFE